MTPRRRLASACACLLFFCGASAATSAEPGRFVPVVGGKLWFQTCGSGPTSLVLLHDGLIHSVGFDAVWPALCASFHVVRYDRRGYGRSRGADVPYNPLDDLGAVMTAAGMKHATLVGASAGGGLAVDMALDHPEAVDRLVLIGAEVSGFKHSAAFIARAAPMVDRMRHFDFGGGIRLISEDQWIVAPGHDDVRAKVRRILRADLHNLVHQDRGVSSRAAVSRLGEIGVPTLVLVGAADHPDIRDEAKMLSAAVPDARLTVMPDAGHLIYMEQPDAFSETVAGFVGGSPAHAG